MSIKEKIRRRREKEGKTQEDLARLLGVTLNAVVRWERGERNPTGLYRERVMEWLEGERK